MDYMVLVYDDSALGDHGSMVHDAMRRKLDTDAARVYRLGMLTSAVF